MGQYSPGFTFVLLDLLDQVFHMLKLNLTPQMFDEFHGEILVVDIIIKIQEQGLDIRLGSILKSRTDPHAGHAHQFFAIKAGACGVDAVLRQYFLGMDDLIRSRKTQL